MYAATRSVEVVKRWGRWRGRAADLYVFDTEKQVRGDAARMLENGEGFMD